MSKSIVPIFEIGKTYRLEWTEGADHHFQSGEVLAWEAPLLKVKIQNEDRIINTASALFIGAVERQVSPLDIVGLLGGSDGR